MGACCSIEGKKLSPEEEEAQMKSQVEENRRQQPFSNNLVHQSVVETPEDKYEILKELGVGSMGKVSLVRPRHGAGASAGGDGDGDDNNQRLYALKTLRTGRITKQYLHELKNEIQVVSSLDHPGIVKFQQVYYNTRSNSISIIMEYCSGGDLYKREPYSEKEAADIVQQVLSAVSYMHQHNYVHRDLKFENIMFESPTSSKVNIIDFGLSGRYNPNRSNLTATYGTLHTMAPEVIDQDIKYNHKCDLWSVGVVAFELICGEKPFNSTSVFILQDKIIHGDYNFSAHGWNRKSSSSKDFCCKLLQVEPDRRPTAAEAMRHEWIIKRLHSSTKGNEQSTGESFAGSDSERQRLLAYAKTPEIQKITSLFIAHNSFHKEVLELRNIFEGMDTEKTGYISLVEFHQAFNRYSGDESEMRTIFDGMDTYGDGRISYREFLAAALSTRGFVTEERIAEVFDKLDVDQSGAISVDDLRTVLGRNVTDEAELKGIIAEVDMDKDGVISLEELILAFRKNSDDVAVKALKAEST